MTDLTIENLDRLRWLLVVVGCGLVMVYGFARKKSALRAFASANLLGVLAPHVSIGRQYVKAVLALLAMVCVVLAMLGPRWGTYWEPAQQRQLDLMVCLDVSKSMLVEDAGMSRLARAKDDITRLLNKVAGGSIGLVTFAGKAELTIPLTDDYEYYRLALEDVGIHSAPMGGTNIGEAIDAATKAFGGRGRQQRAILLMTDGEDHGETAVKVAQKALDRGIRVYTIGIGDEEEGGLIPVEKGGRRSFLTYKDQQMWSKLDPTALKAIALAGGGEYLPSKLVPGTTLRALEWIYEQRLLVMEQRVKKEKQVAHQYARFHWPAVLALVLLVLESLVSERRGGGRMSGEG